MNILIDIGHPAHVHYFRNFIKIMESCGHSFCITARNKEVVFKLLDYYGFTYKSRGKGKNGIIGKLLNIFKADQVIFFAAKPTRPEKNFALAQQAYKLLNNENTRLHVLNDVSPELIPIWMNASDIVLLTSQWEGSPNVIKEAMACNRPIVATNVGDIKWLIGETDGCYLTSFDPNDVAEKLNLALGFSAIHSITNGRERILKLGLVSDAVAKKIIKIYSTIL